MKNNVHFSLNYQTMWMFSHLLSFTLSSFYTNESEMSTYTDF